MHVPIIIITNKDSIETIIGYVKRGEDYSISHLGVMWVQHVVIKSKQNKLILNVYGSSMNGTFIEIVTAEGEVMKTIRTDSLGVYFNGGKEYNIE
jgi:predicted transcriptional regulator